MRAERYHYVKALVPLTSCSCRALKQRSTGAVRVASGMMSRTFVFR
jgi:hypothetical protein